MMMKKVFLTLIALIVLFAMAGCSVPVYNYLGEDPDKGGMIDVNGVIYKSLPETPWRPINYNTTLIGILNFPGEKEKAKIYTFNEDINKIFIMQTLDKETFFDEPAPQNYHYREDIALPPYDSSGIDKIGFKQGDETKYIDINNNKETIKKLFDIKINAQKTDIVGLGLVYFLELMNSNLQGIGINLPVYEKDNTYWVLFDRNNHIAPISQDLLEEIAGKKLPTASEVESKWKTGE